MGKIHDYVGVTIDASEKKGDYHHVWLYWRHNKGLIQIIKSRKRHGNTSSKSDIHHQQYSNKATGGNFKMFSSLCSKLLIFSKCTNHIHI